jgi:methionine synthase I (cobalamin-dependent)
MTFDTRPPGSADPVPPALRTAAGERLLIADGVDCISTNIFGADHGKLGEYRIADRIGELSEAGARIAHHPEASYFGT